MKKRYHTIEKKGKTSARHLAAFLSKNGQFLLPLVSLIEQCRLACEQWIDVAGRAAIQGVRELSAQEVAGGPPHPGQRRSGEVLGHGQQPDSVMRSDRKLAVERAGGKAGEVEIPAYAALPPGCNRPGSMSRTPKACCGTAGPAPRKTCTSSSFRNPSRRLSAS